MNEKDFFDMGIFNRENIDKIRHVLENITTEDVDKAIKLFKMIEVHDDKIVINLKSRSDTAINS